MLLKIQMFIGLLKYLEPPQAEHLSEIHHFTFNFIKIL